MFLDNAYLAWQHPIYALILSIFLLVVVFKHFIFNRKINISKLLWTFCLVFILAFITVFYQDIKQIDDKNILQYVLIALEVVIAVILYMHINNNYKIYALYSGILKSLNQNRNFCLLDKKMRIKSLSSGLEKEFLEITKKTKKQDFMSLFLQINQITSIDGSPSNNQDFIKLYKKMYVNRQTLDKTIEVVREKNNLFLRFFATPIIENNSYLGYTISFETKDSAWLSEVEKEAKTQKEKCQAFSSQLKTLLQITGENIIYHNISENSIWINDNLSTTLDIHSNSIDSEDFYSLIVKSDLENYKQTISNIENINGEYKVKYRIMVSGKEVMLEEFGMKSFISENRPLLLATINVVGNTMYAKTGKEIIDTLVFTEELKYDLASLISSKEGFYLVTFSMDSIEEINKSNGWTIGNMIIGEYLRFIKQSFLDSFDKIYRLSGVEFAIIMTNTKKMQSLRKVLQQDEKILHGNYTYGNNKVHLEVNMGISISGDAYNAKDLMKLSYMSLMQAKAKDKTNYVIYRDEND